MERLFQPVCAAALIAWGERWHAFCTVRHWYGRAALNIRRMAAASPIGILPSNTFLFQLHDVCFLRTYGRYFISLASVIVFVLGY